MRTGIFKRIFVLYTCIILLAVLFIEIYITNTVRDNYINSLKENLAIQATLISSTIPYQSRTPLDEICRRLKSDTGARVTIITAEGRVVGDSDTESRLMDNHAGRIEIQQASLLGTGMTIRYSDTVKYDSLYVAKKAMAGDRPLGYVRLGVPLKGVDSAINRLRTKIIAVVSFIVLAAGFLSIWQMGRIKRLTHQIRDFSVSLTKGELGKKLFLSRAGEFHQIAESLNTMSLELQRHTAEIEEERKRLNVILRNIPDALLISDAKDRVLYSSSAARNFFGDAQIRGRRLIEVVRNREFLDLLDEVRKNLKPAETEFKLEHPEERDVVATVSPLSYRDGEFSGFLAIFHDVTRLKALERVRKDFVANVSHELKTPVAAITGFAETLLDGALDNRQDAERFLEIIRNHSARLQRLVEDLLTLSRIELGEMNFRMVAVDVRHVIENSVTLMHTQSALKKIAISREIEHGIPPVLADADKITQVLLNLLDNAVKFTPEGGNVRISARLVKNDKGHSEIPTPDSTLVRNFVEISVTDTGPGIPPMLIPRLGERFYRIDPARSRDLGGTGLGLAIVKHILQAHGSSLAIQNAPRKGTIVSLCLPVASSLAMTR